MAPDSLAAEVVALALAVLAAVALGVAWNRIRWLRRAGLLLTCLVTAAATGLLWVDRQVEAYPTWGSLLGSTAEAAVPVATAPADGGGRVVSARVAGRVSHMSAPMYVYLPPGYATGTRRYPVIEALHGFPGGAVTWLRGLAVSTVLDGEIKAGRMAPSIVLFPYQTPDPAIDTECTNLVRGPQAETFLTTDVPAYVRAHYRVRGGWGLIGYSAGGYCAADLLLRHPGEYVAGVSMSGYVGPGIAIGDGTERTTYDDAWRLTHLPVPAVALYLACARTDKASLANTARLAELMHAPATLTTAYVNGGGHNQATWKAMEAPAFDWLSAHLPRPADAA